MKSVRNLAGEKFAHEVSSTAWGGPVGWAPVGGGRGGLGKGGGGGMVRANKENIRKYSVSTFENPKQESGSTRE